MVDDPPILPEGVDPADVQRFRLREWWLPDYPAMGMGDALRWFFTREPWSPTGSSDQLLIWPRSVSVGSTSAATQD